MTKVTLRPSQTKNAGKCLRRWAFVNLFGKTEPFGPEAMFGTKVHDCIKDYIDTGVFAGTNNPVEKVARAAAPYIDRTKDLMREIPLTMSLDGYEIDGTLDLAWTGRDVAINQDWKTTGNLKNALKPDQLRTDPQRVIYGLALLQKTGLKNLESRWIYIQRKPTADGQYPTVPVVVRSTYDELVEIWREHIKPIVDKTEDLVHPKEGQLIQIGDIEFDKTGRQCYAYRKPCPFTVECKESEQNKMVESIDWGGMFDEVEETDELTEGELIVPPDLLAAQEVVPINPPEAVLFNDPLSDDGSNDWKKLPVNELKKLFKEASGVKAPTGKTKVELVELIEYARNKPSPATEQVIDKTPVPVPVVVATKVEQGALFTLFLHCSPLKGVADFVLFEEFIEPIAQAVAAEHGTLRWNLLKYGEGKGYLANAVLDHLSSLDGKVLVATGYTDELSAVETVLVTNAAQVVRGTR